MIPLDRFAAMLFEMQSGAGVSPTLERHGVAPGDWKRARHRWLRAAVKNPEVRRALSARLRAASDGRPAASTGPSALATPSAAPRLQASYQRLAATPLPATAPRVASPSSPNPDATAAVDLEKALAGDRLPFRAVTPEEAREAQRAVSSPRVDWEGADASAAASRDGETAMVDLEQALAPSLPFPRGSRPEAAPSDTDGTAAVDVEKVAFGRSLPFQGSQRNESVEEVAASVERYAQVVSVLAFADDRKRALLILGLTEEEWMQIAATWAARMQADPSIKARFDALVRRRRSG